MLLDAKHFKIVLQYLPRNLKGIGHFVLASKIVLNYVFLRECCSQIYIR